MEPTYEQKKVMRDMVKNQPSIKSIRQLSNTTFLIVYDYDVIPVKIEKTGKMNAMLQNFIFERDYKSEII